VSRNGHATVYEPHHPPDEVPPVVSSRSYQGRHHAARHGAGRSGFRVPRAFSSSFVLPTVAAASLVVTATGASVAESAPLTLDVSGQQTAMARTQQAVDDEMVTELALRRQDASMQTAALQGRAEAQVKAARAAERKAAAEKKAAEKAAREAKKWVRPIKTWKKTSNYGWRWGKSHDGIDLGAPTGTPLYAMSKGRVIGSFYDSSFGNKIEIQYWDGSISWYGHLSKRSVREGETVMPGQLVGLVGNTGHSFGSHLHFEMQRTTASDSPIAPEPWLRSKGLL
jgi:murein DD-endopeptidase MepM/ murein hydrolase activator NlpD